MKLYGGDLLVRKYADKYLVAHTNRDKFQLISIKDGNRWTNEGFETSKEGPYGTNYITKEQILNHGNFGEFTVETKQERIDAENNRAALELASMMSPQDVPCQDECVEPTCDFFEEDIELTEKDINYVVSHAAIHMRPDATAGQIVNKISQDVYDFLVGKE